MARKRTKTQPQPLRALPEDHSEPPLESKEAELEVSGKELPIEDFMQGLFKKLVVATRASNALPEDEAYSYYSNMTPFSAAMDSQATNLLDTISSIVDHQPLPNNPQAFSSTKDLATNYDRFQDVLEGFLELTDEALDDVRGEQKHVLPSGGATPSTNSISRPPVTRPQANWTDVDNNNVPFEPRLVTKHHAQRVWDKERARPAPGESWPHPYQYELEHLSFGDVMEGIGRHIVPRGMDEVDCEWVSTEEDLERVVGELEDEHEIAVDLEHHDLRSFLGFTCLIQLSTRRKDYLIDPFDLRQQLHILNRVFAHPGIVKVLHGADKDVEWLQRDFGVYLVNMFDTGQASRVLHFPSFSLAYLLRVYAGVEADKRFQTADWRLRPLPHNMVHYARQDTHYLLYVYDRLRSELQSRSSSGQDLLLEVLNRSRTVCLRRYEKPLYSPDLAHMLFQRFHGSVDPLSEHFRVFLALHKWRDATARSLDESVRYVMPDHLVYALSRETPSSQQKLYEICKPVSRIVRAQSHNILDVIHAARNSNVEADTAIAKTLKSHISLPVSPATPAKVQVPSLSYTTHSTSDGSPVMSTEQLYQRAKWVEPVHKGETTVSVRLSGQSSLFGSDQPPPSPNHGRVASLMNSGFSLGYTQPHLNTIPAPASTHNSATFNAPVAGKEQVNEDNEIPQSMSEIYKLSKRNRKRNKDKKKLKEDNVTHSAPAFSPESHKQSRASVPADETSPLDYMRNIGWVGSEEQPTTAQLGVGFDSGGANIASKQSKQRKHKKNVYESHTKTGSSTARKTNFYKGFGSKGPNRGRKSTKFSKR